MRRSGFRCPVAGSTAWRRFGLDPFYCHCRIDAGLEQLLHAVFAEVGAKASELGGIAGLAMFAVVDAAEELPLRTFAAALAGVLVAEVERNSPSGVPPQSQRPCGLQRFCRADWLTQTSRRQLTTMQLVGLFAAIALDNRAHQINRLKAASSVSCEHPPSRSCACADASRSVS